MGVVEVLQTNGLFKGFTPPGVQIIAGIASERTFPPGSPIFVESMIADAMFVIAQGRVGLKAKTKAGAEVSLGELGAGEQIGELALIQPGQRMCTATALTSVTAIELRHADFQRLLAAKPQACVKLLMAIVSRFAQKVTENREALRSLLGKP